MAQRLKWTRDESAGAPGDFFYMSDSLVLVVAGQRYRGSWTIRRDYMTNEWAAEFDAMSGVTPIVFENLFPTLREAKLAAATASDNAR